MIYFILLVVLLIFIYIGYVNARDTHRFEFTTYEIKSPKIKKEMTIALISDLHSQSYGPGNKRLIKAILDKKPYIILGCGDLYTSSKKASIEPALDLLKGLSEKIPVIIADGNHESKTKISPKFFNGRYEEYKKRLKEISDSTKGITHLVDDVCFIDGPELSVSGLSLENKYYKHFKHEELPKGYIEERVLLPPRENFNILLAHNPLYFEDYVKWGADLVLSGHIHGGVIRLPKLGGALSPDYSLFPKYDAGRFDRDGCTMIVSRGLGTHTIYIRLWNPADIPLIKLVPEDPAD